MKDLEDFIANMRPEIRVLFDEFLESLKVFGCMPIRFSPMTRSEP